MDLSKDPVVEFQIFLKSSEKSHVRYGVILVVFIVNHMFPGAYAVDSCFSHHAADKDSIQFARELVSTNTPNMSWSLTQCMFTSVQSANEAVKQTISWDTLKKIFRTPAQIYGDAVKTAEKLFELNAELAKGMQKVISEGITAQELAEMFPLLCSAAGTIFSGTLMAMMTVGAGAAGFQILLESLTSNMKFAKRLSALKLDKGPEILACVVQPPPKPQACDVWQKVANRKALMENEDFWAEAQKLKRQGNFSQADLEKLMDKYLNLGTNPQKIETLLKEHSAAALPQNSVIRLANTNRDIKIGERLGGGESSVVYDVTYQKYGIDGFKSEGAVLKLPLDASQKTKLRNEVASFIKFREAGIPSPRVLTADPDGAYILSEKVAGPSTSKLIETGLSEDHIKSLAMIYRNGKDHNLAINLKPESLRWDAKQKQFLFVDRGLSGSDPKKIYDLTGWKKTFFANNPKGEILFQKYLDESDLSKAPALDGKIEQMDIWKRAEHGQIEYAKKMEDRLLETLKTGADPKAEFIGSGKSNPELLTFSDGTKAVRKPIYSEYNNARAEVAVYKIDKKLGLNQVPVTVIRDFKGKKYSVQAYVEDASSAIQVDDPANLRFLDSLLYNSDRHNGNYLTVNGRSVAIDNGRSFYQEAPGILPADQQIDEFIEDYKAIKSSRKIAKAATTKNKLANFLPDKKVYENLKNTTENEWKKLLSEDLNGLEIQTFLQNRKRLIRSVDRAISVLGEDIFRDGPVSGLNFVPIKELEWDK